MTTAPARPNVATAIDDAKLSAFHFKAAATAGAGFFTDSYDLNVIATVTLLATAQFHLSSGQISMLTSSTLLAVAIGAVAFGRLGDVFGRRRVYGLEAVLMIIGALVSALSPELHRPADRPAHPRARYRRRLSRQRRDHDRVRQQTESRFARRPHVHLLRVRSSHRLSAQPGSVGDRRPAPARLAIDSRIRRAALTIGALPTPAHARITTVDRATRRREASAGRLRRVLPRGYADFLCARNVERACCTGTLSAEKPKAVDCVPRDGRQLVLFQRRGVRELRQPAVTHQKH